MSDHHEESRRRYIKGQLEKVTPGGGQVKLQLRNEEGETFWLNVTSDQQAAIEKVLLPEQESPVSHAPCITGTIEIDGRKSEFLLPMLNDSVTYSQWGADNPTLWERTDLLEALADGVRDWAQENLCKTCKESMLNDGAVWNGECGDCADKTEAGREEDDDE